MSKYPILALFCNELNKFNSLHSRKRRTKEKKQTVYDNASELRNEILQMYFYEFKYLPDAKKSPSTLFLKFGSKMKNRLIQQQKQ